MTNIFLGACHSLIVVSECFGGGRGAETVITQKNGKIKSKDFDKMNQNTNYEGINKLHRILGWLTYFITK
jgi:hypothetical protein